MDEHGTERNVLILAFDTKSGKKVTLRLISAGDFVNENILKDFGEYVVKHNIFIWEPVKLIGAMLETVSKKEISI